MEKNGNYHDNINKENIQKLRDMLDTLPPFCRQFFRGVDNIYGSRTKIAYAYDLGIFFEFIHAYHKKGKTMEITDYPLEFLDDISREDIEEYMDYLSLYTREKAEGNEDVTNEERGKSRKLASLRSFYNYFFRNEMIKTNSPSLVSMPKLHAKEIVRLDPNEVAILLDQVEEGTKLTKKQAEYHAKTKIRDLAILTLMLGTGIRVSECVGLDLQDVDFDNMGIKVRRKGGYEDVVYFGGEVELALLDYLEQRERIIPQTGHEDALFLSLQNRRLTVRSIEKLVKKYAGLVTSLKKITPHKLRSTYGTNLYQETGDIYLVADVLGHKDVNTTRRHYAAMKDESKRKAAKQVKLREP
ncbi:MAG: tyrosine-type recombinase/integrase [Lachnospiraceae bacterium]|nr:tyrosine-type recombinase/integrase [Lachnospiraceae bacterium]